MSDWHSMAALIPNSEGINDRINPTNGGEYRTIYNYSIAINSSNYVPGVSLVLDYDASGTNFNSDIAIDVTPQLDVTDAGILGNADRTIALTLNLQPGSANYGSNWILFIGGYGYQSTQEKQFALSATTIPSAANANKFAFGIVHDNTKWYSSTLFLDPNVTTTIACSYQGSNNTLYIFKKLGEMDEAGDWEMDPVQLDVAALNTTLEPGLTSQQFLIGGIENQNSIYWFRGTIGKFKVWNVAFNDVTSLLIGLSQTGLDSSDIIDANQYIFTAGTNYNLSDYFVYGPQPPEPEPESEPQPEPEPEPEYVNYTIIEGLSLIHI